MCMFCIRGCTFVTRVCTFYIHRCTFDTSGCILYSRVRTIVHPRVHVSYMRVCGQRTSVVVLSSIRGCILTPAGVLSHARVCYRTHAAVQGPARLGRPGRLGRLVQLGWGLGGCMGVAHAITDAAWLRIPKHV